MVNVAEEVEVGLLGSPGPPGSTVTRHQALPLLRIFGLGLRSGFLSPGTLTLLLSRYWHLRAAGCPQPIHFFAADTWCDHSATSLCRLWTVCQVSCCR